MPPKANNGDNAVLLRSIWSPSAIKYGSQRHQYGSTLGIGGQDEIWAVEIGTRQEQREGPAKIGLKKSNRKIGACIRCLQWITTGTLGYYSGHFGIRSTAEWSVQDTNYELL